MEREKLDHRGRAADLTHVLTGQGRPAELPGEGVSRTSGDKDDDADTFFAPECLGHHGHFVGEKPPLPLVPPMRHDVPLLYTERKAPCHRTLL